MAIAATLRDFLDGRAVSYDVLTHEPTMSCARTAEASHVPGDRLAKAVLLKGKSGFLLAVVPARCKVQIDNVCELIEREVDLATEDDIQSLFADCDRGAIPPLGSAYGLETVIDEQLDEPADIYFEGGDHRSLVHLTQQQFAGLTWDAYHGRIARPM